MSLPSSSTDSDKSSRQPEMNYFEKFADFHFGFERISEIQLCSMEKALGDDGYYFVEHSSKITFNSPVIHIVNKQLLVPIVRNTIDFEESYNRVEALLTKKKEETNAA